MTEWMRGVLVPDSLVVVGAGVFVVGLVLKLVVKTTLAAKFDAVRQVLKQEAQSQGQTERLARLNAEESAIRSMPRRGIALMIVGAVLFAGGLTWFMMK